MRGYLPSCILIVSIFLIYPFEATLANPFCQIPEGERDAVAAFACKVDQDFMTCQLLSEMGYMQLEIRSMGQDVPASTTEAVPPEFRNITTPEEYVKAVDSCIKKSSANVDPLFKTAKTQLQKSGNSGALEALKDLYSYWMTSMNVQNLTKMPGSAILYNSQVNERKTGITERVNRLKVEL